MSDTVPRASNARTFATTHSRKVLRERIVTLRVQADHCPQVLLRILALIAQHATVPLTISAERDDDSQHIAIEIDNLSDKTIAVLHAKIATIVTVRQVVLERLDIPSVGPTD